MTQPTPPGTLVAQPSELPWRANHGYIYSSSGAIFEPLVPRPIAEANARQILRHASSHAALVEALETIRRRSSAPLAADTLIELVRDLDNINATAEAALALVREAKG